MESNITNYAIIFIFIILILILCLMYLGPCKQNELMTNISVTDNEALQNLAAMLNTGTITIDNINVTKNLTVGGNSNLDGPLNVNQDLKVTGNTDTSKNLTVGGNVTATGDGTFGNAFVGRWQGNVHSGWATFRNVNSSADNNHICLMQDSSGNMWLGRGNNMNIGDNAGGGGGTISINGSNSNLIQYNDNIRIRNYYNDNKGPLYVDFGSVARTAGQGYANGVIERANL